MHVRHTILTAAAALALAACGADRATAPVAHPTPVLLRDIVIPTLPSPLYHFEYDSTGRPSEVSFASGFTRYNIEYDHDRIAEMRDSTLVDRTRLVYVYDGAGRVGLIKYTDEAGQVDVLVSFTYDGSRLVRLERDRRVTGGFLVDKTTTLSYYADGNLRELTEHHPAIEGYQPETTTTDRFEGYDDEVNVEAFSLLHSEFLDHLVLLPDVRLQSGNPARVTRTGDGLNYVADFTYTYDRGSRPLMKHGEVTITNGPDAGRKIQTQATYTYQ
jgi:hypothetical protein